MIIYLKNRKVGVQSENHFRPLEDADLRDLFVPRYASYWGIEHQFKHHMFYRQCMLFVAFLENESSGKLKKSLIDIEKGTKTPDAFQASFGTDTMTKWNEFKT